SQEFVPQDQQKELRVALRVPDLKEFSRATKKIEVLRDSGDITIELADFWEDTEFGLIFVRGKRKAILRALGVGQIDKAAIYTEWTLALAGHSFRLGRTPMRPLSEKEKTLS